jgi:branched-subunit amino acid transport protein
MSLWLIMLAAGLVTFATRLSFIFLLERIKFPDWFRRSLRFVPAAVLSAIILPGLVIRDNALDLSWHNAQIFSGILAVLVAWRTRNVILTILAGMAALLLLRFFLG